MALIRRASDGLPETPVPCGPRPFCGRPHPRKTELGAPRDLPSARRPGGCGSRMTSWSRRTGTRSSRRRHPSGPMRSRASYAGAGNREFRERDSQIKRILFA